MPLSIDHFDENKVSRPHIWKWLEEQGISILFFKKPTGHNQKDLNYFENFVDYYKLKDKEIFNDIDDCLEHLEKEGAKVGLLFSLSNVINLNNFLLYLQKYNGFSVLAHTLNKKQNQFKFHYQSMVIDVEDWKAAGRPKFKSKILKGENFHKVKRSEENFHDEYTPVWIEFENETDTAKEDFEEGTKIFDSFHQFRVGPFDILQRRSKRFLYSSEDVDRFHNPKPYYFPTEILFNKDEYNDLDWNKYTKLVAVGTFLNVLHKMILMPNVEELEVVEIAENQANTFRKILAEWDGRDFAKYIEKTFDSKPSEEKLYCMERFNPTQEEIDDALLRMKNAKVICGDIFQSKEEENTAYYISNALHYWLTFYNHSKSEIEEIKKSFSKNRFVITGSNRI